MCVGGEGGGDQDSNVQEGHLGLQMRVCVCLCVVAVGCEPALEPVRIWGRGFSFLAKG